LCSAGLVQEALKNAQEDDSVDPSMAALSKPAKEGKPLTDNQLKRVEKAIQVIEAVHTKSVELRVLTSAQDVAQFISPILKTKAPQPVKGV